MSKKKEKPIDLTLITPEEKLKYEIAEELGLLDKVLNEGWKSLSSKETGRTFHVIACKGNLVLLQCLNWRILQVVI